MGAPMTKRTDDFDEIARVVRPACLAARNANPKPYIWRAKGAEILAKIKRARAVLNNAAAA